MSNLRLDDGALDHLASWCRANAADDNRAFALFGTLAAYLVGLDADEASLWLSRGWRELARHLDA